MLIIYDSISTVIYKSYAVKCMVGFSRILSQIGKGARVILKLTLLYFRASKVPLNFGTKFMAGTFRDARQENRRFSQSYDAGVLLSFLFQIYFFINFKTPSNN